MFGIRLKKAKSQQSVIRSNAKNAGKVKLLSTLAT